MCVKSDSESILRHLTDEQKLDMLSGIMVAINRTNRKGSSFYLTAEKCVDKIDELIKLGVQLSFLSARMKQAMD